MNGDGEIEYEEFKKMMSNFLTKSEREPLSPSKKVEDPNHKNDSTSKSNRN